MEEGGAGEVPPEEAANYVAADDSQQEEPVTSSAPAEEQPAAEDVVEETPAEEPSQPQESEPEPEAPAPAPPADEPAPEPVVEPQPEPQVEQAPQPVKKPDIPEVANVIIQDIDKQVPVEYDNSVKESDWHTWRPRGKYNIPKVEIKYGDLNAEQIPDIKVKEAPKPTPQQLAKQELQQEPVQMIDQYAPQPQSMPMMMNGDMAMSPSFDIPAGIPLLARVLPKEEGDGPRESIPLERLFTPATDSGEITPRKKKAFSSSAFYAPNHPTIEDQVSLAQKISTSLIDENNKMSRGQSMYIKRKKRSVKWIHQGEDGEYVRADGFEDDGTPERVMPTMQSMPAMEIKTGLKVQTEMRSEHTEMQQHLQQVTVAGQPICNPGMKMRPAELQSPTGKGAELFAKRKKRMDQFIVDETNVKQSAVSSSRHQEQTSVMSSETSSFNQQSMVSSTQVTEQKSSKISSGTQYLRSTCTAVQPTVDSTVHGSAGDPANLPDLAKILTKPTNIPNPNPKTKFQNESVPNSHISQNKISQSSKVVNTNRQTQFNKPKTVDKPNVETSNMNRKTRLDSPSSVLKLNGLSNAPSAFVKYNSEKIKDLQSKYEISPASSSSNSVHKEFPPEAQPSSRFSNSNVNLNVDKDNNIKPILKNEPKNVQTSHSNVNNIVNKDDSLVYVKSDYGIAKLTVNPKENSNLVNHKNVTQINENNDFIPELKPGTPPIILYTDGNEVYEDMAPNTTINNDTIPNNIDEPTEDILPEVETGVVNSSINFKAKTNIDQPKSPLSSILSSDLPSIACSNSKENIKKDPTQSCLSETVRSTPSPRPVRPNSLAVIPLSSLVDRNKPHPNNSLSNSSSVSGVCDSNTIQPFVNVQTSFSLAPASKRKFKAVIANVSPTEENNNNSVFLSRNNNDLSNVGNQVKQVNEYVDPQLESSCESPVVKMLSPEHIESSFILPNNDQNQVEITEEFVKSDFKSQCGNDKNTWVQPETQLNESYKSHNDHQQNKDDYNTMLDNLENDIIINVIEDDFPNPNNTKVEDSESVSSHSKTFLTDNEYVTLEEVDFDMERRGSIQDEDIASYISEIEQSLSETPIINTTEIDDLKPPEFYRSVSRNSMENGDDLLDNIPLSFDNNIFMTDFSVTEESTVTKRRNEICPDSGELNHLIIEENLRNSPEIPINILDSPINNVNNSETSTTNDHMLDKNHEIADNIDKEEQVKTGLSATSEGVSEVNTPNSFNIPLNKNPTNHIINIKEDSRGDSQITRNIPHTEGGAVYTAEVKVVQRASLPPTPAATFEIPEDMPHHSILLEQYDNISKEEKRKSFNFAAKGWGTYNNFYTPITFTATS